MGFLSSWTLRFVVQTCQLKSWRFLVLLKFLTQATNNFSKNWQNKKNWIYVEIVQVLWY